MSPGFLYKLSVTNSRFYHRFTVPKKSDGYREILSPSRDLKAVQAWILRSVLDRVHVHEAARGFLRDRNTRHNALPHAHNRFLLCLDIEDFFPSITYAMVYRVFRSLGYNLHVAHILCHLCTCDGKLPQGAVTSPALSNIVCIKLDRRISGFVGKRNIAYTRYADDLTFSCMSPNRLVATMPTIRHIVNSEGFALNPAKTRRMGPRRQRKVTGLVLSGGHVGVGRQQKRKLRAALHRLLVAQRDQQTDPRHEAHVRGWVAHLNAVDADGLAQLRSYSAGLAKKLGVGDPLAR